MRLTTALHRPSVRRALVYIQFILFDAVIVAAAYGLALVLRFGGRVPAMYLAVLPGVLAAVPLIYVAFNMLHHTYLRGWRYAGLRDGLALVQAGSASVAVILVADAAFVPDRHLLPLSVVPMAGLLAIVGMGLGRFRRRILGELTGRRVATPVHRTLIVGAGGAGQRLARDLLSAPGTGFRPVCFLDDDPDKQSQRIHGLPVVGTRHAVARAVEQHTIDLIVIAIPSLDGPGRADLLATCLDAGLPVKLVPSLHELLVGPDGRLPLRDARLDDLLGRPAVEFADRERWQRILLSGPVLITGAAGSIGSELCRQVLAQGAPRLILIDVNESGLFDLAAELQSTNRGRCSIEVVVADVTRARRLREIFSRYQPTTVFHVAAYKHVPLMEAHPGEAVRTNVLGTWNVCEVAAETGVGRVVFISTDKAVAPSSVMGATKRLGEQVIRAFAEQGGPVFCAVRFGNVLGSRGSVVPTFTRQIQKGGPLTVTDRRATRFFMSVPEAASLILEASCHARGGEVLLLDMGERVKVIDIARKMIQLHGLRPDKDIRIEEIGLRPGEKLHEVLTTSRELLEPTAHPKVACLRPTEPAASVAEVGRAVRELVGLAEEGRPEQLVEHLFSLAGSDRRTPTEPAQSQSRLAGAI